MPRQYSAKLPRICPQCGTQYEIHPYQSAKGLGKHCSRTCSYAARTVDVEASFWSRVNKSGDCWLWEGRCDEDGYGLFGEWQRGEGRSINHRAHRYAWQITYGPIPDGLWVLHKCDTPACVNPSHLFLGTNDDNVADMVAKGRQFGMVTAPTNPATQARHPDYDNRRGSLHGQAKLTEDQVREIRRRRQAGVTLAVLAGEFRVTIAMIGHIVHRRSWRHI